MKISRLLVPQKSNIWKYWMTSTYHLYLFGFGRFLVDQIWSIPLLLKTAVEFTFPNKQGKDDRSAYISEY